MKLFAFFVVLVSGFVFVACSNSGTESDDGQEPVAATEPIPTDVVQEVAEPETAEDPVQTERTLYVAPFTELCDGDTTQECLLVRESLADDWVQLAAPIENFDYIAGFNYKLTVLEEQLANPPADGPQVRYVLGEILSQEGSFEAQVEEENAVQISTQVWHLDYLISNPSALATDITLQFGEGQVNGSGGCNDYVASLVNLGDNQLAVESIGASRKLCDELISQQERDFFDALAMIATFEQPDATTLNFHDASGVTVLTFVTSR